MLFLPIPTKEEKGRPEPRSPHDSAAGVSGVALFSRPQPSWEERVGDFTRHQKCLSITGDPAC